MTTHINGTTGVDKVQDGTIVQADLDTAILPIGVAQTWQDVTASRAVGVSYTNSTGRPITVSIIVSCSAINLLAALASDGITRSRYQAFANGATGSVDLIIPNGSTYTLTQSGPTISIVSWMELR